MTETNTNSIAANKSWDNYWRHAGHDAAYAQGGISHPLIHYFWIEFFETVRAHYDSPRIMDIASGNGAVVTCADAVFNGQLADFTCLDESAAAIDALGRRFPATTTLVADARKIPAESATFDVATSLFGIEYAGLDAINEVTRLVVPGGRLAFLLHKRDGSIDQECAASLDAVQRMREARFIPYAIALFEAGFAACQGADRADYEAAARQFAPATRALESVMTEHGTNVAAGMVMRLYDDVASFHEHLQRYEPSDVLSWLDGMNGEIEAFAARMAAMREAAIDQVTFDRICDALRQQGFSISRAESLEEADGQSSLAWVLVATRDPSVQEALGQVPVDS